MEIFGHVMRREGLEQLAVTGKIEGRAEEEDQELDT